MSASISLILTNHPTGDWHHQIDNRRLVIGRADDADIVVPSQFRSVSRRHAEIWQDEKGGWIRDLGSRQGTRVNLIWIDRLAAASVVAGDLIRLGSDVEIQVVTGMSNDDIDAPALSDSDELTVAPGSSPTPRTVLREKITAAEAEVMLWISRGYLANDDLGRLLNRSPHTVRTQVNSILKKLGLHNRGDIVGWLKRHEAGKRVERR